MNILQIFLFPFSVLYGIGVGCWRKLYQWDIMHRFQFDIPVISIGNLSVGGTGKTPMVEYLIQLLEKKFQTATLSRGYGRKTRGYIFANNDSSFTEIGDEPRQFKTKFPECAVAVAENRSLGIPNLLADAPDTQVILMDDAFQSLSVKPSLSILLTDFSKLFFNDYLLPAGRLREFRSAYKRADMIVITKCPKDVSDRRRDYILFKIQPHSHQQVYFSTLKYEQPYALLNKENKLILDKEYEVVLFCGIAKPKILIEYLNEKTKSVRTITFSDHHLYKQNDLEKLKREFDSRDIGTTSKKIIITTEKDAMRLEEYKIWLGENKLPVYVLPIQIEFLFEEGKFFDKNILNYLTQSF